MKDLMDSIIEAEAKKQKIMNLLEDIIEARNTDREQCGNCDFWMKSSLCPAERNVKGRNKGPSISGITCNKFTITAWVAKLKEERIEKIKNNEYFKYVAYHFYKLIPDKEAANA